MDFKGESMRIIFLDVDGVLNNEKNTIFMYRILGKKRYLKKINEDFDIFDMRSVRYMAKLIDYFEGDIKLVISSTWRTNKDAVNKIIEKISIFMKSYNVPVDVTEVDKNRIRGLEIQHYLENNNLLDSEYVIIDDDTADIIGDKYNGMDFNPHFVWCNNKYGFQRKEYKKALKILKEDNYDNSKSR